MGWEGHVGIFSVRLRMFLNSEDGSRLSGRAGKIPDGLMDLWLLHPWETCKPKKLTGRAKRRSSEPHGAPRLCAPCPFLLGTPLFSLLGALGSSSACFDSAGSWEYARNSSPG